MDRRTFIGPTAGAVEAEGGQAGLHGYDALRRIAGTRGVRGVVDGGPSL